MASVFIFCHFFYFYLLFISLFSLRNICLPHKVTLTITNTWLTDWIMKLHWSTFCCKYFFTPVRKIMNARLCVCKDNHISPESCDYQRQRIKNGSLFIHLFYNEDVIADRDGARWSAWLDHQPDLIFPGDFMHSGRQYCSGSEAI